MSQTSLENQEQDHTNVYDLFVGSFVGPAKKEELSLAALKYLYFNYENGFGSRLLETEINKVLRLPNHPAASKVDAVRYKRQAVRSLLEAHAHNMSSFLEDALLFMGITPEQIAKLPLTSELLINKRALLEIVGVPENKRRVIAPITGNEAKRAKNWGISKERLTQLELTYDSICNLPDVNGFVAPKDLIAAGLSKREIAELPGKAHVVDWLQGGGASTLFDKLYSPLLDQEVGGPSKPRSR